MPIRYAALKCALVFSTALDLCKANCINCSLCLYQEVADNQIDTGDLMDCLVQNKHQKEMNDKCAVGVTHFQLVRRNKRYRAGAAAACSLSST